MVVNMPLDGMMDKFKNLWKTGQHFNFCQSNFRYLDFKYGLLAN